MRAHPRKQATPISARRARQMVSMALERYVFFAGYAQWMNGYRAGSGKHEDQALRDREMARWQRVGPAKQRVTQALTAFAKAVRRGR